MQIPIVAIIIGNMEFDAKEDEDAETRSICELQTVCTPVFKNIFLKPQTLT